MINIIGFMAAIFTTVSIIPQAIKTIKSRSTADISPIMYAFFFLGTLCWFSYGVFLNDLPMIFANSITSVLSGIIFLITVRNIIKEKRSGKNQQT